MLKVPKIGGAIARVVALLVVAPICVAAGSPEPGFWLTGLPPVKSQGGITALNKDGSSAAGAILLLDGSNKSFGFTWTRDGGRNDFGLLPGFPDNNFVAGLSDSGAVVGSMYTFGSSVSQAYRWTCNGPPQDLGSLPGETRSHAWGVAGDGNTVVGHAEHGKFGNFEGQAFRWTTAGGVQGLGYAKSGDFFSRANGVSRDGKAIVGVSGPAFMDAFVWTEATGMKILPKLPNPKNYDTYAQAVNADGTVVVGSSPSSAGTSHAVRWTPKGVEDLTNATMSGESVAYAVSDNGEVVVGDCGNFGFIWTQGSGMLFAADYLNLHGVAVPGNLLLLHLYSMSGDGLTFGGVAYDINAGQSQGFVATVPAPSIVVVMAAPLVATIRRRRRI